MRKTERLPLAKFEPNRLQRVAHRCRELMGACVKAWLAIFVVSMCLAVLGVDQKPYDEILLSGCTSVFLLCTLTRLFCIARFVVTGQEMRWKDEIVHLPPGVSLNRLQRAYMGSGMALWDSGWSIPAGYLLQAFSLGLVAGFGMVLTFSLIFMVAATLRIILIHLYGFGVVTIYDPHERLQRINAEAPERRPGVSTVSPTIMRLLMLCRRAGYLLLAMALPLLAISRSIRQVAAYYAMSISYAYTDLTLKVLLWAIVVAAGYFALLQLLRFIIIAAFVARYSILHVMGFNLMLGVLVSLVVTLPPPHWNVLAGIAAFGVIFAAMYFISLQDPEGDKYVPEFVKARARAQRRERWEKKKRDEQALRPTGTATEANG